MKVLVVGNGGREHALAWQAAKNQHTVFVAPGNAGTALETGCTNVPISSDDIDGLLDFATKEGIDLTIVGPEAPLVAGISDRFAASGLACFGPTAAAAQLEGSKAWAKEFMQRHHIPTAAYGCFTEVDPAVSFIHAHGAPIVVKADGLAAGKGVIVAQTTGEAVSAVNDMLAGNAFGDAGHRVVIEEFLAGEEASFIVMADGESWLSLASSQDHKAALENDRGPNTGGMGAYSPAPVVDDALNKQITEEIIRPTLNGLASEGIDFRGFLYAGVMVDASGIARVLEFNVRFGDPETQPVLTRLHSDLAELCLAACQGKLDGAKAEWSPRPALGIVLAAEGYPGSYAKGHAISGLDQLPATVKAFHAGTVLSDGQVVTSGGRVLCLVASGDSVAEAQATVLEACDQVTWAGRFFRRDIGYRAIRRERAR